MHKTPVLFFALALVTLGCQAQRASASPWITGEKLLERWAQVNPADVTWSPGGVLPSKALVAEHKTMMNYQFVEGYISALHDATEGKAWCYSEKYKSPKPGTFMDETRWGLGRLSETHLKANAADLLVAIWREKWPCPSGRWSPK